jgi:hypothetical protein
MWAQRITARGTAKAASSMNRKNFQKYNLRLPARCLQQQHKPNPTQINYRSQLAVLGTDSPRALAQSEKLGISDLESLDLT